MKQKILSIAIILLAIITLGCPSPGSTDESNYNIKILQNGATGSEKITSSLSSAASGTEVTLTAVLGQNRKVTLSANGISFSKTLINSSGGTATFTMPASDIEITAVFEDIPPADYNITINTVGAVGSDEISSSINSATEGATVTLTATIENGRKVSLTANGITFTPSVITTSGNTSTFTMPASDVTINAKFEDIIYNISVTKSGDTNSEAISLSSSTAAKGTEITITASTLGIGRKVTITSSGITITPPEIITSGSTATFTMPSTDVSLTATFADRYQVGDTGPGSGIIFYDDLVGYDFDGDTIIQSDEKDLLDGNNDGTLTTKRYLEAAPSGWNAATAPYDPSGRWEPLGLATNSPSFNNPTAENLSVSVGDGETNSSTVIGLVSAQPNYSFTDIAFLGSEAYTGGTKDDWFIPSLGELFVMYKNKDSIGGFQNEAYWSSTDYGIQDWEKNYASITIDFSDGTFGTNISREVYKLSRPIRSF